MEKELERKIEDILKEIDLMKSVIDEFKRINNAINPNQLLTRLLDPQSKDVIIDSFRDSLLTGEITWNPGNLVDGAGETSSSIAVTGAELGDFVFMSAPYDLQGITATAYVDAVNSVKIRIQNESAGAIDLASGIWRVLVYKK